jgi:hypothetical protein
MPAQPQREQSMSAVKDPAPQAYCRRLLAIREDERRKAFIGIIQRRRYVVNIRSVWSELLTSQLLTAELTALPQYRLWSRTLVLKPAGSFFARRLLPSVVRCFESGFRSCFPRDYFAL